MINTFKFRIFTYKGREWMGFLTNNIVIIISSLSNHHTCTIQVKHLA